jgi:hypothetical protein
MGAVKLPLRSLNVASRLMLYGAGSWDQAGEVGKALVVSGMHFWITQVQEHVSQIIIFTSNMMDGTNNYINMKEWVSDTCTMYTRADPGFLERGVQPLKKAHMTGAQPPLTSAEATKLQVGGLRGLTHKNSSANMHFPGIWE